MTAEHCKRCKKDIFHEIPEEKSSTIKNVFGLFFVVIKFIGPTLHDHILQLNSHFPYFFQVFSMELKTYGLTNQRQLTQINLKFEFRIKIYTFYLQLQWTLNAMLLHGIYSNICMFDMDIKLNNHIK